MCKYLREQKWKHSENPQKAITKEFPIKGMNREIDIGEHTQWVLRAMFYERYQTRYVISHQDCKYNDKYTGKRGQNCNNSQ